MVSWLSLQPPGIVGVVSNLSAAGQEAEGRGEGGRPALELGGSLGPVS